MPQDDRTKMRQWARAQVAILDRQEAEIRRKLAQLATVMEPIIERDEFGPITSKTKVNSK